MPSTPDTQADLALPTLDVRALARRAALPAALAAAAAVAVVVADGPLQAFADALRRALDADPRWVALAVVFEVLSFVGYTALLHLVGSRATRRMDVRASAQVALGGAAATRLLPTGGVGGVALTVWALRRAGLDNRGAARTLLAFLVLVYAVFLGAIALAGAALALGLTGAEGPVALTAVPAAGAGAAIVAAILLGRRAARGDAPAPAVTSGRAARLRAAGRVLGEGVRDARGHLVSGDARLAGALAWWGFDAAVLWAMLQAFGDPPVLAVVVLAYFVGQVGNTLPIPGAVSGGIVGVLLAFGVPADLALVSVLAYRSVAIWLPTPVGLVALGGLRRTLARWKAEDEPPTVSGPAPAPARAASLPAPASPCGAPHRGRSGTSPRSRRPERHAEPVLAGAAS